MPLLDESGFDRPPSAPPPEPPGNRAAFLIALLLLAALVAVLWFADPAHRPSGGSRYDWPPPAKTHP